MSLLRIAAIDFLNPAPLMWNFEHAPEAERLAGRYAIERMMPADCAAQLGAGEADLGLIPIAAYARLPELAVVPGCTVASMGGIRSILLVLPAEEPGRDEAAGLGAGEAVDTEPDVLTPKIRDALRRVRSVALDTSSRTSAMYTQILFGKYWHAQPAYLPHAPLLDAMLTAADAALVIGDPALYALEDRASRQARTGQRFHYLDLGAAWRAEAGVPWVSAFWAARLRSFEGAGGEERSRTMVADLSASRDAGLAHLPELASEWSKRLRLPERTVLSYLSRNIHYRLDAACLDGIARFYADAVECGLLSQSPALTFLS